MAPVACFLVSGFRRTAARLDIILCVLGKSGALISNSMSVFMLSKVYSGCLSQKRNKNVYYSWLAKILKVITNIFSNRSLCAMIFDPFNAVILRGCAYMCMRFVMDAWGAMEMQS